jgi:2-dehydro-3-deoxygalactonokinase
MNDPEADLCAIYVDAGTTNTRVWLLRGREVLARASKQVGVRNSARDGTAIALRSALKELIQEVQDGAIQTSESPSPVCVIAAGMIGSPLGLASVAHLPAPVGVCELSAATALFAFPDVTSLPFWLVPGVRSGSGGRHFDSSQQFGTHADVMRGEETLCVGLHELGLVESPTVVLTLGSHWKAIQVTATGQIQRSVTSLSGEMIDAVRKQTILASSVGEDWPDRLEPDWLQAGMAEQRRSGLTRALFSVRLLELEGKGTPEDRLAYLLGAFIATDLDALVSSGVFGNEVGVVISGHTVIAEAWAIALAQMSVTPVVLTEAETENAFLTGLNKILTTQLLTESIATNGSTNRSAVTAETHWRSKHGCETAG